MEVWVFVINRLNQLAPFRLARRDYWSVFAAFDYALAGVEQRLRVTLQSVDPWRYRTPRELARFVEQIRIETLEPQTGGQLA